MREYEEEIERVRGRKKESKGEREEQGKRDIEKYI